MALPISEAVRTMAAALLGGLAGLGSSSAQEAVPLALLRIGIVLPENAGGHPDTLLTAVENGAAMAEAELGFGAALLGIDLDVQIRLEPAERLADAAAQMVGERGLVAIVGGVGLADAAALAGVAEEHGIPFVNILAPADTLRNERCSPFAFHVAPSAAMYLDALAGWFVRAGFRRWHFVGMADQESTAQHARALRAIDQRHFGVRAVGHTMLDRDAPGDFGVAEIARSGADLAVLLMPADLQLRALGVFDRALPEVMVTGFPYPATQTRDFFVAARHAAPRLGAGFRIVAWEPTLDAYGARELNARYLAQWDVPMEQGAWAAYQAIKVLYEAAAFGGSVAAADIRERLVAPETVFDVWKGIGASFRPWDRQLRQPLYLVKVQESSETAVDAGLLVGELPAIYMPGTDPVERLDQIGDLETNSRCGN